MSEGERLVPGRAHHRGRRAPGALLTDYRTVLPGLAERLALPQGLLVRMTGTVDPVRFTASLRACLTVFFDQHLRGRHPPLPDGPSPLHPDVRFIG
ncbi:hypothetical protein [Streptomyces rubradiris]|nr:hypothetical protein [Streptomyces rubradiris]